MKTLELELKKKVLIVDENDFEYYELSKNGIYFKIEKGDRYYLGWKFEFLCKGSELTEEIASELVDYWQNMANDGFIFENYKDNIPKKLTANDALISAVESKGFYWLENPIGNKPMSYNLPLYKIGNRCDNLKQWQEAEEKTFRNPLIFVKND